MSQQIQFSHSRVSTYQKCPAQYKFRYIDRIRTVHDPDPDDDGIVGNALHIGAEKGESAMIEFYYNQYTIIDDAHVNEAMKLSVLLPKVTNFLNTLTGAFRHEYVIDRPDYKGIIDLIVGDPADLVDIYDFKYSNNVQSYMKSEQLHLYKFYLEREKFIVNRLHFIFIPKLRTYGKFAKIKQRKNESLYDFRKRFLQAVQELQIEVRQVSYDFQRVKDYWEACRVAESATHFPKQPTRLCDWCSYQDYCLKGDDTMILPNSDRRQISEVKRKTLWIYGAPFSGKTWFANSFPAPLMLNTDGNIDFVDAPYVAIRNEISVEGRITKTTLAWSIFKDTIGELEKKQNDFQSIVVDLVEDCYEHCRLYIYDKHGIEHESDNSFKYYDVVKTEFLSTMKRLLNLPYDIILISHEDLSKDLTRKSGDKVTRIAPNIQEKTANKIAGMVQLVARVVSEDDEHWLTFKTSEVEFGGGRLGVRGRKIPLEYSKFVALYDEINSDRNDSAPPASDGKPKRSRKSKGDSVPEEGQGVQSESAPADITPSPSDEDAPPWEQSPAEEPAAEETPRRSRRSRSDQPAAGDSEPPADPAGRARRSRSQR